MTTQLPPNIEEFNELTAVIFAQLYIVHPLPKTLEPDEVAGVLGRPPAATLPSGRPFNDVFAHTVGWLVHEKYIYPNGAHPRERVQLTDKALVAMNVVPPSLGRSRGSELVDATKSASTEAGRGRLGEIVAAVVEGITKGVIGSQ
ncbi:hypothetical protein [Bradyrhizobium sp. SZCCHNS3051]|uniref:hypothetical protein n=1 Tax=Bradyrhizobium sp. SZCCHNS3051 TaxID=3057320 RepID=UPI0029160D0D|nr:hypothetical protein [Bradyrhizobium sp. SZCCHNS3051]